LIGVKDPCIAIQSFWAISKKPSSAILYGFGKLKVLRGVSYWCNSVFWPWQWSYILVNILVSLCSHVLVWREAESVSSKMKLGDWSSFDRWFSNGDKLEYMEGSRGYYMFSVSSSFFTDCCTESFSVDSLKSCFWGSLVSLSYTDSDSYATSFSTADINESTPFWSLD